LLDTVPAIGYAAAQPAYFEEKFEREKKKRKIIAWYVSSGVAVCQVVRLHPDYKKNRPFSLWPATHFWSDLFLSLLFLLKTWGAKSLTGLAD
jgi:hypothetical protein